MELEEAPMTIVMGFDQHRAQITTEWIDSLTGDPHTPRERINHKPE